MFTLVTFFVLAVVISFICSLSEAGLLSMRRTDVMKLKESAAGEVVAFSRDQTVEEVCREISLVQHSRFPVFGSGPDDIVRSVVTVREDETLETAAARMQEQECKMALVTDDQDRYVGVLSTGDLLRHLFGGGLAQLA